MYPRKKPNRSGTISVVVVSKSQGQTRYVHNFGTQLLLNRIYDSIDFKQRFNLGEDFIVVADSGLMNADNVKLLRDAKYKYVIGARIKGEKKAVKEKILGWEKKNGEFLELKRENGERLIVGYSESRAKKDAYNRNRGVERLRKAYGSGILTKDKVNRRGYNKFLEISKDVEGWEHPFARTYREFEAPLRLVGDASQRVEQTLWRGG